MCLLVRPDEPHVTAVKNYISSSAKNTKDFNNSVKRSARVSLGIYDSKIHCLFCGTEIQETDSCKSSERDTYSYVKTDTFVETIVQSKTRGDK